MGADDKITVNFLQIIVLAYQAWYIGTMYRLEEGMKVSEFVKRVIVPVVSALFWRHCSVRCAWRMGNAII